MSSFSIKHGTKVTFLALLKFDKAAAKEEPISKESLVNEKIAKELALFKKCDCQKVKPQDGQLNQNSN